MSHPEANQQKKKMGGADPPTERWTVRNYATKRPLTEMIWREIRNIHHPSGYSSGYSSSCMITCCYEKNCFLLVCTLVHCVCKSPSNKIIKTHQVSILDNHKKQEQQQERRTRREHKQKKTHDKKKKENKKKRYKKNKMKNNNIEVALWAILFLTMSSVSRWLSGPSCFLQCHLSLCGSLGHLVCCNVICL